MATKKYHLLHQSGQIRAARRGRISGVSFAELFTTHRSSTMTATAPAAGVDAQLDLDSPYPLTPDQIAYFREKGYVKLKNVLSPAVLAHYGREITRKVIELNTLTIPMEQR